jgi:hypothetical protein
MKRFRFIPLLIAIAGLGGLAPAGRAQIAPAPTYSANNTASSPSSTATPSNRTALPPPSKTQPQVYLVYVRPTEKAKIHSYLFDAFGPFPIAGAVIFGADDQATKTPPEWGQGMGAYGERVGSVFGIELVTTTTRYALAEALREDTIYYRCECSGLIPRLKHALISTVTARVGEDGHRRLSFPALIAPYAGSMTAVYGWYPSRYGVKDGFRMGNYSLLAFAAGNILEEFIYGGPHTIFRHFRGPSGPDATGDPKP